MPNLFHKSAEALIAWLSILSVLVVIFSMVFGFLNIPLPYTIHSAKFTLATLGFFITGFLTCVNAIAICFVKNINSPETNLVYAQLVLLPLLGVYIVLLAISF